MTRGWRWIGLAGAGAVLWCIGNWRQQPGPRAVPAGAGEAPQLAVSAGRGAVVRSVAQTADRKRRLVEGFGKLPIAFEPNVGQASADVRFLSRGRGYGLYLTPDGAKISVAADEPGRNTVVRMKFEGARPDPRIEGRHPHEGRSNYFLGNNPARWFTDVPHFGQVAYSGIYDGIDLVYYGNQSELEYDIVVQRGADPNQVRMRFEGVSGLRIADGDLILVTPQGELKQRKPIIYQRVDGKDVEIAGRYVILGRNRIAFEVDGYDRDHDLVIDPVFAYSSYLGGGNTDLANGIAVDDQGSAYVAGGTDSTNFPGLGEHTFVRAGFVTKLSPAGDSIVYTAFIGGSGTNWAKAVAVDSSRNAYVTGLTTSSNFPTVSPFQAAPGGGDDGFVAKLNPNGNALIYSSYIGGSGDDFGSGIAVDASSNAYITGTTVSSNFPTVSPVQGTYGGAGDAFVSKINAAGTALVYSTFLGGSFGDAGERIAVDASGAAHVAGGTSSTNFPTASPLQASNAGALDAFLAKLNPAGSALTYSTYLGGSGPDSALDVGLDSSGAAYITGYTLSTNFPVQSAQQGSSGGGADAFVSKVNAAGSALVYSTYLGGSGDDFGYGIAVDTTGRAFVAGMSASSNFPNVNGEGAETGNGRAAFLVKYTPDGSDLLHAMRYGGAGSDEAADIAVDGNSNAYVTGATTSFNFPVYQAAQPQTGGAYDAFVSKFSTCTFQFDWSPGSAFEAQGAGGSWTVAVTAPSGCPWVASSLSPWITVSSGASGNGNGSVQFSIQANPTGDLRTGGVLIAGTEFSVHQGGGPALSSPQSGLFFYAYYGSPVSSQSLTVNYGSASSASFSASAQTTPPGGTWLGVSPLSGNITGGQTTLTVSINTASLSFNQWGEHHGTILVTSPGATNSLTVPVTLYTYPAYLFTEPEVLTFNYNTSGSPPSPKTVTVTSGLSQTVNYTVSSSAPFVQASPTSGATSSGVSEFSVSVNITGLAVGIHTATVTITPAQGFGFELPVRVVVDSGPSISAGAHALYFYYDVGTYPFLFQEVPISASNGEVFYNAQVDVFGEEQGWLSVSPDSGVAPDVSQVRVNASLLPPGFYEGVVYYSYDGSTDPQEVLVYLTVSGSLDASPGSLQFNYSTGGAVPPAQSLFGILDTFNGSIVMSASAATVPPGGSWLSVTPSSGFGGSVQFQVSVNPNGLSPGTYQGQVTISSVDSGLDPVVVPVSFVVSQPHLSVNPTAISGTYSIGQGPAGGTVTQSVSLSTNGGNVAFSTGTTGGSWLSVSPPSGTTPANLTVTMNPSGLSPGTYNGTVNVTSAAAAGPVSIPVTFTVQGLSASPAALTFGSFVGGAAPPPQYALLPLLGAQFLSVSTSVSSPPSGTWLSAALVAPGANGIDLPTAAVSVSVNPAGLTAGTYNGSVTVTPADFPARAITIPVTYIVGVAPALNVPVTPLTFSGAAGSANVPAQTVPVSSTGSDLEVRLAPTTTTGGNWLTASLRNGATPADVMVSVSAASLSAGSYSGSIVVFSPNDSTGPKTIPVNFSVNGGFTVQAAPASLSFGTIAGVTPASQNLAIQTSEGTTTFGASATVTSPIDGNWLSVSPPSGSISPTPTNLSVSVNPTGLGPGSYTGSVLVTVPGAANSPFTVPVALTVVAPLTATAPCPAPLGIIGQIYSLTVAAGGGVPGYTWSLINGPLPPGLNLNPSTGLITGIPTTAGTYPVTVRVTDSGGPLQQTANYTCNLVVAPPITITATCPATTAFTNAPYSFPISATGGVGALSWEIVDGSLPAGLLLNPATGVISGTTTVAGSFPISVRVLDSSVPAQFAFYNCAIVVSSTLTITAPCPAPTGTQGTPYSFTISAVGGNLPLTWQLANGALPPGLTLNAQTGVISGTPTASGTFPISVQVFDTANGNTQTATYTCALVINPSLAITAPCPAPVATQGVPYSFTVTAAGGNAPYTWQLLNGPLPPGLTLNTQTGVISGTPTASGTYPVSVRVSDTANGNTQTATYTCSIVVNPSLMVTAPCPAPGAVQGTPYSFTLTATGGNAPFTWQLVNGPLPPGLTLNSQTGVISGTPTASGTYPITVQVSDTANGNTQTATYTCNIVVTPSLSITAPCPATAAIQGSPYSFTVTATGGNAPLTWQLTNGPLPPGLTLNTQTGVISGTPTASGTYPVTIQVSDSANGNSQTATYTCNIVVTPALTITAPCPAAGAVQGLPYSFTVTATGGQGTLVWQLLNGPLPPGLSLNTATGAITGTPTAAGTYPIAVRVTDGAAGAFQQSATYECPIVVTPTLSITAACPAQTGVQGTPYSLSISVTGGAGPFTWQLLNGPLPPGLSLNTSTGAITGTPTANGSYPIAVRVTDSGAGALPGPGALQQTATYECNIVIVVGLAVTTPCPAPSAVEGKPYSLTLAATGGQGSFTWQLAEGSTLPAGLTLNGATGVISGTPTVPGTFPVTIRVTDSPTALTYGGQTATYTCNIVVVPVLKIGNACTAARGTVGVAYSFSLAVTGGSPPYTYAFSGQLPPGLSFNPATGIITGTPNAFGLFDISIQVTDSGTGAAQQTQTFVCAIRINTAELRITSPCPGAGQVGAFFTHNLTATGGDGTYVWSVAIGSLPAGLNLTGGQIRGTPDGPPGVTQFQLQVSSDDKSDFLTCSMTVNPPVVRITSGCPGNGRQGVPYTPFTITATGGNGPGTYTFSIVNGSLPPGLTLTNGVISGTPQGPPGTSSFSLQATSGNLSGTLACGINVAPPILELTGTCPASALVGTPVSATVTASGGQPPYSFTFSGSPFLTFANGTVSGTPTQVGTAEFSVTVNDAANSTPRTFACSFPVNSPAPPLQIGASCPGPVRAGAPVSIPLAASGGTAPFSWSINGPPWLTLSSATGASVTLNGTPPSAGFFDFTVTLNDSINAPPATFRCTLTVNAALQLTASGCPTGPVAFQSPIALSFSAAGGVPPYSWTYGGPAFLTLGATTGASTAVTGIASTPGTFTATVTLSDDTQAAPASSSCTIVVNPAVIPPITFTGPTLPPNPTTPAPVTITLGSNTPVELRGVVRLTFVPNARNPIDNPQVHFSAPCLRECPFVIPPGTNSFTLPNVEVGLVAGTIRIEIVSLLDGDRNVLPTPAPFSQLVIPPARPVITSLTVDNERADGFDVVISGYSNTREIASVTLTFAARADSTLEGDTSVTRDVSALFDEFYRSARSVAGGSMFEVLRIPITVTGDKAAIASVTAVLTNGQGASEPATRTR